jgi:hypothetical protein
MAIPDNARTALTVILGGFAGISMLVGLHQEWQRSQVAPTNAASETRALETSAGQTALPPRLIVTYAHGSLRCETCRTIEAYASEAVRRAFVEEMARGEIVWRDVVYDAPEHADFPDRYNLVSSAIILIAPGSPSDPASERWRRLDEVWQLTHNRDKFQTFIVDQVNEFLDETRVHNSSDSDS